MNVNKRVDMMALVWYSITTMMRTVLSILQVVLAILLMGAVLLQQKGVGLGSAFGGSSNIYTTKRGVDKFLFRATIAISILFFALAVANLLV